jgi:hypothetical protein
MQIPKWSARWTGDALAVGFSRSVRIVILQYSGWSCGIGAQSQVLDDMNERATSFSDGDLLKCTQQPGQLVGPHLSRFIARHDLPSSGRAIMNRRLDRTARRMTATRLHHKTGLLRGSHTSCLYAGQRQFHSDCIGTEALVCRLA